MSPNDGCILENNSWKILQSFKFQTLLFIFGEVRVKYTQKDHKKTLKIEKKIQITADSKNEGSNFLMFAICPEGTQLAKLPVIFTNFCNITRQRGIGQYV